MVRNGVTRSFGASLRRAIASGTRNRITSFFCGLGVTGVLQSSTATILITSTFAAQGIMSCSAAIAVILGADVGTTLVAQLLSFDVSWMAPLFVIGGYLIYSRYGERQRGKHTAYIVIGLGLMLMALGMIREAAEPMKHSQTLGIVLHSLENDLFIGIVAGALITWLMHSSLAFVLLLISLVSSGFLTVGAALYLVLGANLGNVVAPVVATMKDGARARRAPIANVLMRVAGVALIFPFVGLAQDLLNQIDAAPERMIVNFHTGFNLLLALLFLPFTGLLSTFVEKVIPEEEDENDPGRPVYLDKKAIDTPVVALSTASRETLRVAELVKQMLNRTMESLEHNNEAAIRRVHNQDNIIDRLYYEIKMYLSRLSQESMDPEEAIQYVSVMGFATNLEHIGDIIDKSMLQMAAKKVTDQKRFSQRGWLEIRAIHDTVVDNFDLAQTVFLTRDVTLARKMIAIKDKLRDSEQQTMNNHLGRIREGVPETIETSSLHLDIIRDYRRINSHLCTVAYNVLEASGDLLDSRLKPEQPKAAKV